MTTVKQGVSVIWDASGNYLTTVPHTAYHDHQSAIGLAKEIGGSVEQHFHFNPLTALAVAFTKGCVVGAIFGTILYFI